MPFPHQKLPYKNPQKIPAPLILSFYLCLQRCPKTPPLLFAVLLLAHPAERIGKQKQICTAPTVNSKILLEISFFSYTIIMVFFICFVSGFEVSFQPR